MTQIRPAVDDADESFVVDRAVQAAVDHGQLHDRECLQFLIHSVRIDPSGILRIAEDDTGLVGFVAASGIVDELTHELVVHVLVWGAVPWSRRIADVNYALLEAVEQFASDIGATAVFAPGVRGDWPSGWHLSTSYYKCSIQQPRGVAESGTSIVSYLSHPARPLPHKPPPVFLDTD